MILSEERIDFLANTLLNKVVWDEDWVEIKDTSQALRLIKQIIGGYCQGYDDALQVAKDKLSKQKTVVPGSTQWDILLEKYIQEELRKKGFRV
jgi:hypothetical protein